MADRDNSITLDAHLGSIQTLLHDLRRAQSEASLTPDVLAIALQQVASNFRRDFPDVDQHTGAPIVERSVQELLGGYLQRVQDRRNAATTGIGALNRALNGGFPAQRLIVLLGAPGSGKTSFANQMAEHVATERPVLYVTSEDAPDILLAKTLARIGQVKYSAVLYGWNDYQA